MHAAWVEAFSDLLAADWYLLYLLSTVSDPHAIADGSFSVSFIVHQNLCWQ